MNLPESQERTDVRRRTGPPPLPSGLFAHLPEPAPHQFCGSSVQPVDDSIHSSDSMPRCLNGAGCDCAQCRKLYGRHIRQGSSSSPRKQDRGGPSRKRPGRPPLTASQDQDRRPRSKKTKTDEEPRASRPDMNPNDWLADFLENCQQLGREYEPFLLRARFFHEAMNQQTRLLRQQRFDLVQALHNYHTTFQYFQPSHHSLPETFPPPPSATEAPPPPQFPPLPPVPFVQGGPPCAPSPSVRRDQLPTLRTIPQSLPRTSGAPRSDVEVCPICHRSREDLTDMTRTVRAIRERPDVGRLRSCIRFHQSTDDPLSAPRSRSDHSQPPPSDSDQPSPTSTTRPEEPAPTPDPETPTPARTRPPDLRIAFDLVAVRGPVTVTQVRATHSRLLSDDRSELNPPQ